VLERGRKGRKRKESEAGVQRIFRQLTAWFVVELWRGALLPCWFVVEPLGLNGRDTTSLVRCAAFGTQWEGHCFPGKLKTAIRTILVC